ncbi:hypothetical protein SMICM17S_03138 [Streptomyces microflavus]
MKLAENQRLRALVPVTPGAQLPPDGRPDALPRPGEAWRVRAAGAERGGLPGSGRLPGQWQPDYRPVGGSRREPAVRAAGPARVAPEYSARPPGTPENRAVTLVRSLRGPCTTQPALPSRTTSGMLPPTSRVLLRGSGRWRSDAVPLGVWGWEDDSRTELSTCRRTSRNRSLLTRTLFAETPMAGHEIPEPADRKQVADPRSEPRTVEEARPACDPASGTESWSVSTAPPPASGPWPTRSAWPADRAPA